jgi:hypothetical protein
MANRPRKISKSKAVKSIARERIGSPPASRAIAPKSDRKKPKHKKEPIDE